nr:MAG TPA: hypothetical protein [Caudoviricetes sp.]
MPKPLIKRTVTGIRLQVRRNIYCNKMNERVTLLQAKRLRRLGYNKPCSTYHCAAGNQIKVDKPMNWNAEKRQFWYDNSNEHQCTSIPKCDDVINWLREKYKIIATTFAFRSMSPDTETIRYETHASCREKSKCKLIFARKRFYKDIFAAKRGIITKCLTYIESLSK